VQVYPAVEYDFVPSELVVSTRQLVHVQWTGSNTHLNGAPGGDGQTGNDGQGQPGTDRNNLVQIGSLDENFPLSFENSANSIWNDVTTIGYLNNQAAKTSDKSSDYLTSFKASTQVNKDLALYLATSGYYQCQARSVCKEKSYEVLGANALNADLNNAYASLPGAVLKFEKANKNYSYMCSRNNNFSNRSQKGSIIVV
jgi:hypothetical protein